MTDIFPRKTPPRSTDQPDDGGWFEAARIFFQLHTAPIISGGIALTATVVAILYWDQGGAFGLDSVGYLWALFLALLFRDLRP